MPIRRGSHATESWRLPSECYDDGGYSDATADRPALRRLTADVAAHRVDAVVIYKIDRLTRYMSCAILLAHRRLRGGAGVGGQLLFHLIGAVSD